jgi:formylglycine-generating enzyme required for sulfatase activity
VGSLRPNDLGLFDLHGNATEWCQSRYEDFEGIKDSQKEDKVDNSDRSLRGGAFVGVALYVRSAYRYGVAPAYRNYYDGFRPARTFR